MAARPEPAVRPRRPSHHPPWPSATSAASRKFWDGKSGWDAWSTPRAAPLERGLELSVQTGAAVINWRDTVPESEIYFKCSCQNCGGHIEFPASAVGAAIPCPHCSRETVLAGPAAPRKKFGNAARVCLFLVMLAAAGWRWGALITNHRAQPAAPSTTITAAPAAPNPVVLPPPRPNPWHGLYAGPVALVKAENGGLVYAVGVLTNESDHERFGVKVQLNIIDDNEAKAGTATDYTQSILPGKEWKFRALITARNPARAEITKVTEQQ
jgi:hypothetical protein